MKREPFPLRSFCVALVSLAMCALLNGCKSPQQVSNASNKETKVTTQKVADGVNKAQAANVAADDETQELIDDPATPEPVRNRLKVIHANHVAANEALKPINPEYLPKIVDAADRQLQATLDASNAARQKEEWIISWAVGGIIFLVLLSMKIGPAVSAIGGLSSVLLTTVVIGIVSDFLRAWGPYAIGIAIVGVVLLYIEKQWKGSWKATLHAAFDDTKQAAKQAAKELPADVDELWEKVEAMERAAAGKADPTPATKT